MANPKFINPNNLNVVSQLTLEVTAGAVVTTYIGYMHPTLDSTKVAIRRIVRDGTNPNAITGTDYWADGDMYCNYDWANVQTFTYEPLKNFSYAE